MTGRCEICGHETYLEAHHVFHGVANRRLSEKWGMVARLCPFCHRDGMLAVHRCYATDLKLKRKYQRIFEADHSREEFRAIFGRSYADD